MYAINSLLISKYVRPDPRRDSLWFDSRKRPLNLGILGGRLREVRLYLKIGDTHEAQYTFRMFCYEERPFNRKEKVSSFIFPEVLVKNVGKKQNHPVKIDSLFRSKRSNRFFSNFIYKLSRLSSLNP